MISSRRAEKEGGPGLRPGCGDKTAKQSRYQKGRSDVPDSGLVASVTILEIVARGLCLCVAGSRRNDEKFWGLHC